MNDHRDDNDLNFDPEQDLDPDDAATVHKQLKQLIAEEKNLLREKIIEACVNFDVGMVILPVLHETTVFYGDYRQELHALPLFELVRRLAKKTGN